MTSLFLSKTNFNIYNLPSSYELLNDMGDSEILTCMQIINKETAFLYNDFKTVAQDLYKIQNTIQNNVLEQYKTNTFLNDLDKEKYLNNILENSRYNYELLDSIYTKYVNRYKTLFPSVNIDEKKINFF